MYRTRLREKLNEALRAVLPIVGIVLLLGCTIAPIPSGILMAFLVSSLFLIVGMMLFSLGAELAMEPMGERLGIQITKTRKFWLVILLGFLMGALITVSEPDLSVLANQVQNVPNAVLILTVSVGVGVFLSIAISRMLFSIALSRMLVVFYGV